MKVTASGPPGLTLAVASLFLFSLSAVSPAILPVAARNVRSENEEGEAVPLSLQQAIEYALMQGDAGRLLRGGERDDALAYAQALSNLRWGVTGTVSYDRDGPLFEQEGGEYLDVRRANDRVRGQVSASGARASLSGAVTHSIAGRAADSSARGHSSSASVSTSYTLFDGYPGGLVRADRAQAGLAEERRKIFRDSDRRDLQLDVVEAYVTLSGARAALAVRELSLERRIDEYDRTRVLFDVGEIGRIDLLQARINRRDGEDDLERSLIDYRAAARRLALLTGFPADTRFSLAEISSTRERSLTVSLEEAIEEALRSRGELRQAEIDRAVAGITADRLRADRRPTVSVGGGLAGSKAWSTERLGVDWNVGLTLSVPILDPGAAIRQERGEIAAKEIEIARRATVESIRLDVERASQALRSAERNEFTAELRVERERLEAQRIREEYEDGIRTRAQWLSAQVDLSSAEMAREQARINLWLSVLDYDRALGLVQIQEF